MKHPLTLPFLSLALALTALPGRAQTTTHTAETANNTSACSGAGAPGAYCQGSFAGVSSTASGTYDPQPDHVSNLPQRQLLYSGNTTKVYAAMMPWFTVCHTSASYPVPSGSDYLHCDGHFEVGYNSNDTATVDAQVSDMVRRGFDGISIAWWGPPQGSCPAGKYCVHDGTAIKLRDNLDGRCSGLSTCPVSFLLRVNDGMINGQCTADANQPGCLVSKLDAALDYANTNYLGHVSYLQEGNRPVLSFFITESSYMAQCTTSAPCNAPGGGTCTSSSACWTKVWSAVRSHVQSYSNGNPMLLFRNSGGFAHAQSDGSFAWVSPGDSTDPYGLAYLDRFYTAATSTADLPLLDMGGAWKGFDGAHNSWNNSQMAQRCGRTWLDTWAKPAAYYSTSQQLPYLLVSTWNDYEEGTEIETGIDNCWAVSAAVAGSTLSWSLSISSDQPNAATNATESTIDHYEVFDSADGENLTQVATAPRGARSVDLSGLPIGSGARTLYVKAAGAPSILNNMSSGLPYSTPTACVSTGTPGN